MTRKIILMMSVSIDGFIEGPNREIDWHMVDDELHSHFNEQLRAMGAFLDGRVMYELMASFWPTADADPSSTPPMVEFARIWRDMPKFVFSRTLERADWNTTIVREVVPEEIQKLKEANKVGWVLTWLLRLHPPEGMRDFLLYLPLYNGVSSVEIGLPTGSKLEKAPARPLRGRAQRTFARRYRSLRGRRQ